MNSVLVDTSIWSEHFRSPQQQLVSLLESGLVVSHELVIEELALSMSGEHQGVLQDIISLGLLPTVTLQEYLHFVTSRSLSGRRIGCVDTHLLASCVLANAGIYTLDKHLAAAASDCGVFVVTEHI
jgi:predicted nucleic acid-binding protein